MFSQKSRATLALQIARTIVPLGAIVATLTACAEQDRGVAPVSAAVVDAALDAAPADDNTFFGPSVALGAGTARTYVTLENGVPAEVGVEMTEGALQGLPAVMEHAAGHSHRESMFELALPAQAGTTAYKSVNLGWMPNGHEPPYNRPHFDFHFYMVSEAEHEAIDRSDPEWAQKASNMPAPQYWPARYFPLNLLVPGTTPAQVAVPGMGIHWLDVASPELHGAPFTYTFFYGGWNGALIFDEPMVTKATLETRQTIDVDLPPAAAYQAPGLHARGYKIYFTNGRHRVALTKMQ